MPHEARNLALVRDYFDALARGPANAELEQFFSPDAVQEEFPNRFLPHGARRDLEAMRQAALRGQHLMAEQRFELLNVVASGSQVAVEARWEGTLSLPAGDIPAGTLMRARFGMFFEFRDGKIVSQRNYDCFDPW
jgi:ketosteroid isomerase-like protein